jgi:hypothetical protein
MIGVSRLEAGDEDHVLEADPNRVIHPFKSFHVRWGPSDWPADSGV